MQRATCISTGLPQVIKHELSLSGEFEQWIRH